MIIAAKWNEPAKDALDRLVLGSVDMDSLNSIELIDHVPFDPTVKRTEGTVRDTLTNITFKTTKGAPHIILKLINNSNISAQVERDVYELGERGIRSLAVAKTIDNNINQWEFLGLLTFLDPPRADTKQTIADARDFGVAVKMITGDHLLIAKETSRRLDLGMYCYVFFRVDFAE